MIFGGFFMSISVLYIHHCGQFGGSSKSLLKMIKSFPRNEIKAYIITPYGTASNEFEKAGIPVIKTRGIAFLGLEKYYRGWRFLILFRDIVYIFFTIKAILKAKKKWPHIDLIHINEFTVVFATFFAKLFFKKPIIVHARLPISGNKKHIFYRFVRFVNVRYADVIIAIDKRVKQSLPLNCKVKIVHNGSTLNSENKISGILPENWPKIKSGEIVVGFVAYFLIIKGVHEFVEAANLCIKKGLKIHFVMIGDNSQKINGIRGKLLAILKIKEDIKLKVRNLVKEYKIEKNFHIINFTYNINNLYKKIDIICFPHHYGATGRAVFESAFYKVPSIVAGNSDMLSDVVKDGISGICIPIKNANKLAESIEYLYLNPDKRKKMGEEAYKLAMKNFDAKKNAKIVLEIYKNLINK